MGLGIKDFSIYPIQWGLQPASAQEILDVATHAEALGFYSVTIPHIPLLPHDQPRPEYSQIWSHIPDRYQDFQHDALVLVPMLAAVTSSIRIGFNIAVLPWLHPFVWAKYHASLDAATNGRVIAGFGLADVDLYENFGFDPSQRGAMADEALEMVTRLWTSDAPLDFDGRFFKGRHLIVEPKPVQKPYPELWWAAQNIQKSVPRAAKYGTYLEICAWLLAGDAATTIERDYLPAISKANQAVNGNSKLCAMVYANVLDADLTDAEMSARHWGWTDDRLHSLAVGSPKKCASVISRLHGAGVSHFVLDMQRHGYDRVTVLHRQMEIFVDEVLPLLAEEEVSVAG